MNEVKQVIVLRKDLKMRRGKEVVQGAHAAMSFLVKKLISKVAFTDVEMAWMNGLFTKVCVQVNSEDELLAVAGAAQREGLQVEIVTDSGKTEFGGVPTRTCLAVGPDLASKVDIVTHHLPLY